MRIKDARQTFLGWWIRQILTGEEIRVFGEGNQLRDFNYIDDVVEALLLAAVNADGQTFNLGGDDRIPLGELASLLVELNGSGNYQRCPFPEDLKTIDIGDYYADYSLIRESLGWSPKIRLREGLVKTLQYYREHQKHYL
jgi:UDP-glucose 4-epimerase